MFYFPPKLKPLSKKIKPLNSSNSYVFTFGLDQQIEIDLVKMELLCSFLLRAGHPPEFFRSGLEMCSIGHFFYRDELQCFDVAYDVCERASI
jgi:hypothetical protein